MYDYAVTTSGIAWLGVNTNSNLDSSEFDFEPFKLEDIVPPEDIPNQRNRTFPGDQAIPYETSWMDHLKNHHVVFNLANGTSVILKIDVYEGLFRNTSNILTNLLYISSDSNQIKLAMSYNTTKTVTITRDVTNPKGFVTFEGLPHPNSRIVSSYFT